MLPAQTNLPIQPVDPNSPVPLYYQVEMDLRAIIRAGTLSQEDVLPPETELSKMYGVGRQTIRMALARLVNDNLIARQPGRGTFILPQSSRTNFYLDRSFTHQIAEMGMLTRSIVVHSSTGKLGNNAPRVLRDFIGAPYLNLVRLRFGNDEPVGLQYATIITQRCAGIEKYDFSKNSLYDVLSHDFQLAISEITHTVTAVGADAAQADLLNVLQGEPLLQVNTTALLENRDVIEYTISYYRANKYEFSTTHTYQT